ncbi:F-box/WD repeat-containing protein 8 isoform X2 [Syngnathoides biaculeatus]|uniref:F-box/WD repeat-containing protein 8 isoform X2 n=1 Tax=Syngnathoides biaculeatus TaxID=300417 RepID=UPI002ADE194D|nr:F-box/WD repeat-containing protein 8 isoform X2 [Syngnathoides biaculeatus]
MAGDELAAFRDRWKRELWSKKEEQRVVPTGPSTKRSHAGDENNDASRGKSEIKSESSVGVEEACYVSIAKGLLGGRTSPLLDRLEEEKSKRKRKYQDELAAYRGSLKNPQSKAKKEEQLVDQLILDLNEASDVPFFDMELPYELALKIFRYLNRTELGRCAQVSKAWRALAEDSVLWYRLCAREGHRRGAAMFDSPCWKATLRDCRNAAANVRTNWKNRVGSISKLQFELGKVLCDVSSCDNYVVAGYSSGDVRLWDRLHWDLPSSYLKSNRLSALCEPRAHVAHVQVAGNVAAAAYRDGCVDIWSTQSGGEPIYHHQMAGSQRALALSLEGSILASAADCDVRLDGANDCGAWRMLSLTRLPKPVHSLVLVPGSRARRRAVTAVVAGDSVYLLDEEEQEDLTTLHSVYGHPVTCLDASERHVALGVKHGSWAMHDGGNKIHVYSLETGKPVAFVGDSPGDFTCIRLHDDNAPHMMVCGNNDRRVRVFDLRTGSCVCSLYAHQLGVTSVRMDDWKVVSGGGEGLVCVWEMRMGTKLWEMHNRHPVRHVHFDSRTLLTANIPDDKTPRGACITDDDLTAHRRHRGIICHYDFSEEASTPDGVLPICRSNYNQSHGYNYNIALAVPYDRLR